MDLNSLSQARLVRNANEPSKVLPEGTFSRPEATGCRHCERFVSKPKQSNSDHWAATEPNRSQRQHSGSEMRDLLGEIQSDRATISEGEQSPIEIERERERKFNALAS